MNGRRILITNDTLNTRFGAEVVTRDLALGLAAMGQEPTIYSPRPGTVSEEIRAHGILVVQRLEDVPLPPEIIHGNQHLETIQTLTAFPEARAIFVCHAGLAWPAVPPLSDRIQHYVAVDHFCLERLTANYGVPAEKVSVIFNSVDTDRFKQRPPLPERPRRALVFSNYATDHNFLPAIRAACQQINLPLDVIGTRVGNLVHHPEHVLPSYDVVFAKARCALEAMAVGNAVILCDESGIGPMVSSAEVRELQKWNFGMRTLKLPIAPARILNELERYDAADAGRVSDYIRSHAAAKHLIQEYLSLYEKVLALPRSTVESDGDASQRAMLEKMTSFEFELFGWRNATRMDPLSGATAAQITLTDAKVCAPLLNGYLWVRCVVSNPTSERLGCSRPAPINLSYHWFDTNGNITVFEGVRTPLIPSIEPGGSQTYEMKIAAPPEPGEYRLRVIVLQEGVSWFDELPNAHGFADIFLNLPS
jgi:hypothetical protein